MQIPRLLLNPHQKLMSFPQFKAGVDRSEAWFLAEKDFYFFCTKTFLRPRRSGVPSFSAVFRLEMEEKGKERTIVLIHSGAPSPVVVPDKEPPHVPNNKRKSGCCRTCRHPVRGWTILAHWQASEKDAACSRCCWWSYHHLAWGWSLSSHYRWCRRAFK